MSGTVDRLERILASVSKALVGVGGVAIIALMLHICADVVGRYFFNQPVAGTLEIVSWYYMVACVFLPVAYAQYRRQHLMVEMFTMSLPPRRLAFLDGVVALVQIVYVGLLTWLVFEQAVEATREGEFLELTYFDLPAWPSRWVLPVSFGLFSLVLILQAAIDLVFAVTGRGRPTFQQREEDAVVTE